MSQREIDVTPGQFGWLMLAFIFAGTATVQVYLSFATSAWWPAWVAVVLGVLALGCVRAASRKKKLTASRTDGWIADTERPTT